MTASATEALELHRVLHALSDPVRLDIVRQLHDRGESRCGEVTTSVGKSTLSHHLKTLREAGLTDTRAEGTTRIVSLRSAELESAFPGLLEAIFSAA